MHSLLSQLLAYGTYQYTVINYLHACDMCSYESQSPSPNTHIPPNFYRVLLPQQHFGARAHLGNAHEYVLCVSLLPIIFIILWRKTQTLELGAVEDKRHKPEERPSPLHPQRYKRLCLSALCCFSHATHASSSC